MKMNMIADSCGIFCFSGGNSMANPVYTVKAAAKFLQVKPNTLYRWALRGNIRKARKNLNSFLYYRYSDLKTLRKQIERRQSRNKIFFERYAGGNNDINSAGIYQNSSHN